MATRRIGLIQTRGIGDILIALPIADFYIEQGCEVVWPVDETFFPIFQQAKPKVIFLPVAQGPGYFYDDPRRMLREAACDQIACLYSYLSGKKVYDERLSEALKFDEYKYAISDVPFARKWTLHYERQMEREEALFARLDTVDPFICVHDEGSNVNLKLELPEELTRGHQIVKVEALTDNFLDWRLTLERSAKLVLIDSSFANLVEGLNLPNEKYLVVRSPRAFTPVYRNGWRFTFANQVLTGT